MLDNILQSGWERRRHPNFHFLWYEDMKKDMMSTIRGLCQFLGKHLTEFRILQLDDLLYIDNFRYVVVHKHETESFSFIPPCRKNMADLEDTQEEKEERKKFIRKGKV